MKETWAPDEKQDVKFFVTESAVVAPPRYKTAVTDYVDADLDYQSYKNVEIQKKFDTERPTQSNQSDRTYSVRSKS